MVEKVKAEEAQPDPQITEKSRLLVAELRQLQNVLSSLAQAANVSAESAAHIIALEERQNKSKDREQKAKNEIDGHKVSMQALQAQMLATEATVKQKEEEINALQTTIATLRQQMQMYEDLPQMKEKRAAEIDEEIRKLQAKKAALLPQKEEPPQKETKNKKASE